MFRCWLFQFSLLTIIIISQINNAQGVMLGLKENSEFSLNLERVKTNLNLDNNIIDNNINRIYISIFETPYAWFRPGLKLGYLSATQTNNPTTAGINLTGEIIGISLKTNIPPHRYLNTHLEMDYLYHIIDNETPAQKVSIKWLEFLTKAGILINPGTWRLSFGGYFNVIDGDETAFGAITRTRHIKEDKQFGSYLDFTVLVDATGKVGIRAQGGSRSGINLEFSREF